MADRDVVDNRVVRCYLLDAYGSKSKADNHKNVIRVGAKSDESEMIDSILPDSINDILIRAARVATGNGTYLTSPHRIYFYLTMMDFISPSSVTAFINGKEDREVTEVEVDGLGTIKFVSGRMFSRLQSQIPKDRLTEINMLDKASIEWEDAVIDEIQALKLQGKHHTKRSRCYAITKGLTLASNQIRELIERESRTFDFPILTLHEKRLFSVCVQKIVDYPKVGEDYRKYLNSIDLRKMLGNASKEDRPLISSYLREAKLREDRRGSYIAQFMIKGLTTEQRLTARLPINDNKVFLTERKESTTVSFSPRAPYSRCYVEDHMISYFRSPLNTLGEEGEVLEEFERYWIEGKDINSSASYEHLSSPLVEESKRLHLLPCHLSEEERVTAKGLDIPFNPSCLGCDLDYPNSCRMIEKEE